MSSFAFSPPLFGKGIWGILNYLDLGIGQAEAGNKWQNDFVKIFSKLVADIGIIPGMENTIVSDIAAIELSPNDKRATINEFNYSQIVSASTLRLRLNWQTPGKYRTVAGMKSCENLCFSMPALGLTPRNIGGVTKLTRVQSRQSNSHFILSASKDRGLSNFAQMKELMNSIDPMDPGKECIIELCPASFENIRPHLWLIGFKFGDLFIDAAQTISRLALNKEGADLEIILLLGFSRPEPTFPTDFRDQPGNLDKSFLQTGANFPVAGCCVQLNDYRPSN
jgi:hypothetical protein